MKKEIIIIMPPYMEIKWTRLHINLSKQCTEANLRNKANSKVKKSFPPKTTILFRY